MSKVGMDLFMLTEVFARYVADTMNNSISHAKNEELVATEVEIGHIANFRLMLVVVPDVVPLEEDCDCELIYSQHGAAVEAVPEGTDIETFIKQRELTEQEEPQYADFNNTGKPTIH